MGFSAVRAHLIGRVRAATPHRAAEDHPFVCEEDGSGRVPALTRLAGRVRPRSFDLRVAEGGWPRDDGAAGDSTRRLRASLVLRVAYPLDGDRADLEAMIAEDFDTLTTALMTAPTAAGWGAAGGVTVDPPELSDTEPLVPPRSGDEAEPVAIAVSLAFDVTYWE